MDDTGQSEIRVEFFGPFREFGTERLLALEGPVLYGELVSSLAGELGHSQQQDREQKEPRDPGGQAGRQGGFRAAAGRRLKYHRSNRALFSG
jgi:hypothetical protein